MPKKIEIINENNVLMVIGELDYSNAITLFENSLSEIDKLSQLKFDLSKLKTCNSVGLALILEWVKVAKKNNKPIQFQAIPSQLQTISQAAGIESLIPRS